MPRRYVPTSFAMGFVSFAGPFLLGVGPLLALFFLLIARKSFVVLLSLASAFYWLSVLMVISALFRGVTPLPDDAGSHAGALVAGVLLEQAANYVLWKMNTVLTRGLADAGRRLGHGFTAIDALWLSLGMGFGHAATHSAFFFVSLLEATGAKATRYDFASCPGLSFNTTSALLTLGFALFHTFSTVIFFEGLTTKNPVQTITPPLTHLLAALLTLANYGEKSCMATIPLVLAVGVASTVWAAHLTWEEVKKQFPLVRQ